MFGSRQERLSGPRCHFAARGPFQGLGLVRRKADFQAYRMPFGGFFWGPSPFGFHALKIPVNNLFVNPLTAYLFTGKIIDVGSNEPNEKPRLERATYQPGRITTRLSPNRDQIPRL
jgi:hypothetical protein